MNAEVVVLKQQEQREKDKKSSDEKKARDKVNREIQKQKKDDRKDKEKQRTQKGERRRWLGFLPVHIRLRNDQIILLFDEELQLVRSLVGHNKMALWNIHQ